MASLSESRKSGPRSPEDPGTKKGERKKNWRILFFLRKRRKTLRPGFPMHRRAAEKIKARVEDLVLKAEAGTDLSDATKLWLAEVAGAPLGRKLVSLGLAEAPADPEPDIVVDSAPSSPTVREFIDGYLKSREGTIKWRTMSGSEQDQRSLLAYLGQIGKATVADVSRGDARNFVNWLKREGNRGKLDANGNQKDPDRLPRPCAPATISRRIRRCGEFFQAAVDHELIAKNPFARPKGLPSQENKARFHFVTRDETEKMLAACPTSEWRLIIALSRFGGLRMPSETLALTWDCVDWERNRLRVPSPKTEHHEGKGERIIPLFPELRVHLEAAFDAAEPGAVNVITGYRGEEQNLRTQLLRIIRRAGLTPWPRIFHNMRATRQNELAKDLPIHVVCRWIGNGALIAAKHYLEVTDDYFEAAAGNGAQGGTARNGNQRIEGQAVRVADQNLTLPVKNSDFRQPILESRQEPG
jgi:integrase